jgi:hypothetical protein
LSAYYGKTFTTQHDDLRLFIALPGLVKPLTEAKVRGANSEEGEFIWWRRSLYNHALKAKARLLPA